MNLKLRLNIPIIIILCCLAYNVRPLIDKHHELTGMEVLLLVISCFSLYLLNAKRKHYKGLEKHLDKNNSILNGKIESLKGPCGIVYKVTDNYQYEDDETFKKIESECEICFKGDGVAIDGMVMNDYNWHVDDNSQICYKYHFIPLIQEYNDTKQILRRSFAMINEEENVEISYLTRDDGSKYIVTLIVGKTFSDDIYDDYVSYVRIICTLYFLATLPMYLYK